jgi:hypothetical protein
MIFIWSQSHARSQNAEAMEIIQDFRDGKEYQEFIELILAGEFDFHSLSAKRGDVAALA